jgi:aryl-alcohol dehydrogenase-like predicted oxidoreductase
MQHKTLDDTTVGTIRLGDLTVRRLGFGAMRISSARNAEGKIDRDEAIRLSRRVYERGVNFIDVANIYGYGECELILAEALHPYPKDLVIGTKAGYATIRMEPGMKILPANGHPDHIRQECEKSLKRLRIDCIDLYQIHTPDPDIPWADTVGAFVELQKAGKVRHIGLSNVNLEQLNVARSMCEVVSVQNRYNLGVRDSEAVLEACEAAGIAFLPFRPVDLRGSEGQSVTAEIAAAKGALTQQVAVAWLLRHSNAMLPIPGTSKLAHLDENVDGAWVTLSDDEMARLDAAAARVAA